MKKITLLLALFLATFYGYSQCTIPAPGAVTNTAPADASIVPIVNGNGVGPFTWTAPTIGGEAESYTISLGLTPDLEIGTIPFASGQIITFNWVSNTTYYWGITAINCAGSTPGAVWSFTTDNCTVAEAPGAVANTAPADASTVPIVNGNGVGPFTWTAPTTGGEVEGYVLSLGLTTDLEIGSLALESGQIITFNWAANTTYYWSVSAANCAGSTPGPVWSFTTEQCLATEVPGVVSYTSIADMAVDVPISDADEVGPFSWVDSTGGPIEGYTISLGLTPNLEIGTIPFENNNVVVFPGWEYETTYYWRVTAVNCVGGAPGPVWSFTTGQDPILSNDEFDISDKGFSIYPNPTTGILNIKSANSTVINSAEIFNQVGQRVMAINQADITNNTLDVNNLNSGIYFVALNSDNKKQIIKFVKQ